MFESPVKQSLSQSTEGDYSVLLVLTRKRDLSRSANAISAKNRKFFHPSHLAPSIGVTPFEFMEKLYGSRNYSLPGSRR